MGEPNARNGSKPARIGVVSKRCPERAEFFALPIVRPIKVALCCEPRYEPGRAATPVLVHSLTEDASS